MPRTSNNERSAPNVYVALLRAVNVGGNNIVSMRELKESFEESGFTQVSTYINSGNVIFTTKETDARKLERKIEQMLNKDFQIDSKVVVRSLPEMEHLVQSLPKSWTGARSEERRVGKECRSRWSP